MYVSNYVNTRYLLLNLKNIDGIYLSRERSRMIIDLHKIYAYIIKNAKYAF